jgi:hypothetical protein
MLSASVDLLALKKSYGFNEDGEQIGLPRLLQPASTPFDPVVSPAFIADDDPMRTKTMLM